MFILMFTNLITITLVLGRAGNEESPGAWSRINMQEKQVAGLFLGIFLVVAILGILSAIAVPHVSQMIHKSKVEAWETEYQNIQTAVAEMLLDSTCGTLEPIGPTADMSKVHTRDATPLVLADYLLGDDSLKSGCSYAFTANGTVVQVIP
jgi:hypothetical protein